MTVSPDFAEDPCLFEGQKHLKLFINNGGEQLFELQMVYPDITYDLELQRTQTLFGIELNPKPFSTLTK